MDASRWEPGSEPVRDEVQGCMFAAWSVVAFPFPSPVNAGGAVNVCCLVSVLFFTLFLGSGLTYVFGPLQ